MQQFTHRSRLFKPVLAGANLRDRLWACGGALLGIAAAGLLGAMATPHGAAPLLIAPIGASAVLLFAVPASPLAQPWPIIGGNVVSALVGVGVAMLALPAPFAAGAAVAAAILVMSLLRCLHPPGGAAALTAVLGSTEPAIAALPFPVVPIALNSVALVCAGLLYHRLSGHSYPHTPLPVPPEARIPPGAAPLPLQYLDAALEDLGETFDVSRDDLEALFRQMEVRARQAR